LKVIRSNEFVKRTKKVKDKKTKQRLLKQIKKIIHNPEVGMFLNYEKGIRKMYIPPFRLLYSYEDDILYLLDLGHRGNIYKKRKKK